MVFLLVSVPFCVQAPCGVPGYVLVVDEHAPWNKDVAPASGLSLFSDWPDLTDASDSEGKVLDLES